MNIVIRSFLTLPGHLGLPPSERKTTEASSVRQVSTQYYGSGSVTHSFFAFNSINKTVREENPYEGKHTVNNHTVTLQY
jgi:hypothetical protein